MTVSEQMPLTLSILLREDPPGVPRAGQSRVLLELVIHAFQGCATPEGIVQSWRALSLPDAYAVVSDYLPDPGPIDAYLSQRDEQAAGTRRKIEASQPAHENLRELIMARARAKGLLRDRADR